MNTQKLDLLTTIFKETDLNEKLLSQRTGYPPMIVKQLIGELREDGFLRKDNTLPDSTIRELKRLKRVSGDPFDGNIEILTLIANVFNIDRNLIRNIEPMDKGMTNYSFKFSIKNKPYIMRVPGVGTDEMINRENEYSVYKVLKGRNLTDEIIYINPENGYKITSFMENANSCDPRNLEDVRLCMDKLRELHSAKIKVDHRFDLFEKIEFYEELRNGEESIYKDYKDTKKKMYKLKNYIDNIPKQSILTHIDPVGDNFLLVGRDVRLIDWEYSGMQDPNVDIAMFSIYASYNKKDVDKLINIYYPDGCKESRRIKIYSYIAICGFLWSNWCEYKRVLGVDFGEYALKQYNYAKDFYEIAKMEIENSGEILYEK